MIAEKIHLNILKKKAKNSNASGILINEEIVSWGLTSHNKWIKDQIQ